MIGAFGSLVKIFIGILLIHKLLFVGFSLNNYNGQENFLAKIGYLQLFFIFNRKVTTDDWLCLEGTHQSENLK